MDIKGPREGVPVTQVSIILFSAPEFVSTSIRSVSRLFSVLAKEFSYITGVLPLMSCLSAISGLIEAFFCLFGQL